ncbi:MAG TPA: hypothetical protein PLU99_14425 [Phycisphaerae bacterium]|nr:hypothetical protein [Phycisphaerae bacterium]
MTPPRVLLLTGTLPSESDVGGLILRDLVRLYPPSRLCCCGLLNSVAARPSVDPGWLPTLALRAPRGLLARRRGGLAERAVTHARFRIARRLHRPNLVRRVVAFAREHQVELVWAVLNQPVTYGVAPAVADCLNVPLVVTVWDPPDSVCLNANLDRFSTALAVRDFERALGRASRCGVISEAMQREYEARYECHTVVMRHAVRADECTRPARCPNSQGPFTIGFCGSLYAVREFRALLAALDAAGWQIAGRPVRLRMVSAAVSGRIGPNAWVEWLGWRPQREVIRILSESDVNYLPYWFDMQRRNAVRLCFPSKLTTYLAAGRPVLFHGPDDAAPAELMRRHPIGVCCHSLAGAGLVAALSQSVSLDLYARAAEAIERLVASEFNAANLPGRLAQLLGASEPDE